MTTATMAPQTARISAQNLARSLRGIPYRGPERRSLDPVDRLSRRLDAVCVSAVDPLQIAAALEADGITDERCRRLYDMPDVFTLAEEIYRRVPPRAPAPEVRVEVEAEEPVRSRVRPQRSALANFARGALFALPALSFLALYGIVDTKPSIVVLVAVTILGWGLSLGMSIVASRIDGRDGDARARRFLVTAIGAGATVFGAAGLVAAAAGGDPVLSAALSGLLLYLISATALIELDRDAVLAGCLLPGAFLAAAGFTVAPDGWAGPLGAVSVALTVALATGAALHATLPHSRGAGPLALTRGDLDAAAVFGAYGVLAGFLVTIPAMAALSDPGSAHVFVAASMLPLALSMGVAEHELRRMRRDASRLLGRERNPSTFGRAAVGRLAAGAGRFAVALALLTAVAAVVAGLAGELTGQVATVLLAEVALGTALYLALVLCAHGRVTRVVSVLGPIVAAQIALWAVNATRPDEAPAFLWTASVVLAAMAAAAVVDLKKVENHR